MRVDGQFSASIDLHRKTKKISGFFLINRPLEPIRLCPRLMKEIFNGI